MPIRGSPRLLATGAALGVLELATSGGPLGDLVGIPEATPVPIQLPIGIFAILFGLSMDYEVFLLSRIKEEYERTGDNVLAVADGLAKSAASEPALDARSVQRLRVQMTAASADSEPLRPVLGPGWRVADPLAALEEAGALGRVVGERRGGVRADRRPPR